MTDRQDKHTYTARCHYNTQLSCVMPSRQPLKEYPHMPQYFSQQVSKTLIYIVHCRKTSNARSDRWIRNGNESKHKL